MTLLQLRVYRGRVARKVLRSVPRRASARGLARLSSRVADRLKNVPVEGQFNVRVARGTSFRYLASPSDAVGRALYWSDLRRLERETWTQFVPLAARARCFVDIGSFTGAYTLVGCAVNSRLRCFAFEPVPQVYERLCTNIGLNGWGHRVTAVHAAVSGTSGAERFWLPDREFPDTGHLDSSARVELEAGGSWVEVPTTTLSSALPEGTTVDLMKIDVEDAEGPVVASIADVLARDHPAVVIEMLATGSYEQAVEILSALGYTFHHLTGEGMIAVDRPAPRVGDPHMNYLCLP
jgi:FkbM family methyltransferase